LTEPPAAGVAFRCNKICNEEKENDDADHEIEGTGRCEKIDFKILGELGV
jgi:hypothetical protein